MDQTQDASSASSAEPAAGAEPLVEGVTSTQGQEIPAENLRGEFNRKFGKLTSQVEALMQYVMTQQQLPRPSVPQAAPAAANEPTDDELWTAAQNGNRDAFMKWNDRQIARQLAQTQQVQRVTTLVDQQIGILFQRYPMFRDATHPLTQMGNAAYSALLTQGYPATRATALEAMKTAIADNPDLIADIVAQSGQTREQTRRSAAQVAQSGMTGVTHRQQPAPAGTSAVTVREGDAALAARMGVKDPKKAKERFLKRQEEGKSSLGAVSAFVNPEDF